MLELNYVQVDSLGLFENIYRALLFRRGIGNGSNNAEMEMINDCLNSRQ